MTFDQGSCAKNNWLASEAHLERISKPLVPTLLELPKKKKKKKVLNGEEIKFTLHVVTAIDSLNTQLLLLVAAAFASPPLSWILASAD